MNINGVAHFALIGLCSLAVTTMARETDARTVPGAAALSNIAGEQFRLSIDLGAVRNNTSIEAGVTIPLPVDTFDKYYTPSVSVVMDEIGTCRSIGVRSDNGWYWTQGWKSNTSETPVLSNLALGSTWVPAGGTMIVECWLEGQQLINRVTY